MKIFFFCSRVSLRRAKRVPQTPHGRASQSEGGYRNRRKESA